MRLLLVCGLLGAFGCATARPEKVSFQEAFGATPTPAPMEQAVPTKASSATSPVARPVARQSLHLHSALLRFAAKARSERAQSARNASMPLVQRANWEALLADVDAFLKRPAAGTSSFDLIRARVALEAELEMDARAYAELSTQLSEEILRRVTRLALRMAEVRSLGVKTRALRAALAWPIEPVLVTSLFGKRLHPLSRTLRFHAGLDLAAKPGQLVSAAGRGVVTFSGWNGAHGKHVELQHAGGLISRYSHLSQLLVEPGLEVAKGDPLGLAGSTGSSTGAHLHFELLRGGQPVDPLEELGHPLPSESLASW